MNMKLSKINKKYIIYGLVIAVLVIFSAKQLAGSFVFFITEEDFEKQNQKIAALTKKLGKLYEQKADFDRNKVYFVDYCDNFWDQGKIGHPETRLSSKITELINISGIEIINTKELKRSKKEGIVVFEQKFSGKGSIESIANFLESTAKNQPALYWKNLSLRPVNRMKPDLITIEGTITALKVENETLKKLFPCKKKWVKK